MTWFDVKLPPPNRRTVVKVIIIEEAAYAGVTVGDMLSRTRRPMVVQARRLAMGRARRETGLGYNTLGELFHKDHTSVVAAVGRFLGLPKGSLKGKLVFPPADYGEPDAYSRDHPADAHGEVHAQAPTARQEIPL